ncbi:hypothetical protein A2U01_0068231, partial [Trifolium medium]|nr:hypothetical protein [Trifolium medium]
STAEVSIHRTTMLSIVARWQIKDKAAVTSKIIAPRYQSS